jgi:hypothetical protein
MSSKRAHSYSFSSSHRPFAVDYPKPLGAGFYPTDLGEAEWEALSQGEKDRLGGLLTMVEREEGGSLVTRNYSQVDSHSHSDSCQLKAR